MARQGMARLAEWLAIVLSALPSHFVLQRASALRTGVRPVALGKNNSDVAPGAVSVFYHIYTANSSLTHSIVREQIQIMMKSPALGQIGKVFYVTIGKNITIPECPHCRHLMHSASGSETISLQFLWQHCKRHKDEHVLYMHSKGSFHPRRANDRVRRFLTTAAFSSECLHMPRSCNLCSARFSPVCRPRTPGNMWVASCEYISRLWEPNTFERAMTESIHDFGYRNISGNGMVEKLSLGRYVNENWAYSHPSSEPCDVFAGGYRGGYGQTPLPGEEWTPALRHGVRFPVSEYTDSKCSNLTSLSGRLHEYEFLYKSRPQKSSWFWRAFRQWDVFQRVRRTAGR